jgi:hypothetical protein
MEYSTTPQFAVQEDLLPSELGSSGLGQFETAKLKETQRLHKLCTSRLFVSSFSQSSMLYPLQQQQKEDKCRMSHTDTVAQGAHRLVPVWREPGDVPASQHQVLHGRHLCGIQILIEDQCCRHLPTAHKRLA